MKKKKKRKKAKNRESEMAGRNARRRLQERMAERDMVALFAVSGPKITLNAHCYIPA